MIRRIFALLLSLILALALFTGCSAQHWRYEELSFTLPGDFQNLDSESYAEDFDFLFDDGTVAIAGIRETKAAVTAAFGQISAEQYARLVIEGNELTCTPVQKNGLWCFSYEAVSNGTPMTYICAIHEAENSFWQVQAYCATADFAAQQDTMWTLITAMEAG